MRYETVSLTLASGHSPFQGSRWLFFRSLGCWTHGPSKSLTETCSVEHTTGRSLTRTLVKCTNSDRHRRLASRTEHNDQVNVEKSGEFFSTGHSRTVSERPTNIECRRSVPPETRDSQNARCFRWSNSTERCVCADT